MTTTSFNLFHINAGNSERTCKKTSGRQAHNHRRADPAHALRRHAIALAIGMLPVIATGQPVGGQVVSGSATILQSGTPGHAVTTVKQNSDIAAIQWKSFNLGTGDVVNFVQPSKASVAINRITDTAGSKILGHIQANGQVWLLNPNGILFGKDAQINVGGLLVSTLGNKDLVSENQSPLSNVVLSGGSLASVVNLGQINTAEGGYVALLGHTVSNQGNITSSQGSVALGAGSDISLQFEGSKLLSVKVQQHQLDAMAGNGGLLQADGGRIILTAGARDSVLASAVNNTGVVQARTVQMREGSIVLLAGMKAGVVKAGGSLDASAPDGGHGGSIETSAANVQVDETLKLTTASAQGQTGEWRIDPTDFVVNRANAATTANSISATTLSNLLANSNITIETNQTSGNESGDIWINGAVSWNTPYKLSFKAYRDIYINDVITSSHSNGKLHLAFGQGSADGVINGRASRYWVNAPVNLKKGQNFSTQNGAASDTKSYYVITELGNQGSKTGTDLQGLDYGVSPQYDYKVQSLNYVLGADIDASATAKWSNGQGFKTLFVTNLTTDEISYQGTFDGLGHVITGLTIKKPSTGVQSLFSVLGKNGVIQNLGMKNVNYVTNNTGGIVFRNFGVVRNSFVDGGSIIAGDNFVNLSNFMGGLVGNNRGQIWDSYANVTVGMPDNLGTYQATSNSNYKVGGLVGVNVGSIINSYASGKVYASDRKLTNPNGSTKPLFYVGGLVGQHIKDPGSSAEPKITRSFWNTQAYAAGEAPASAMIKAVNGVGQSDSAIESSMQVSGLSAQQMRTASNFSDWNNTQIWLVYDGQTQPLLRAFMTPLYLKSSASGSKTYDG